MNKDNGGKFWTCRKSFHLIMSVTVQDAACRPAI